MCRSHEGSCLGVCKAGKESPLWGIRGVCSQVREGREGRKSRYAPSPKCKIEGCHCKSGRGRHGGREREPPGKGQSGTLWCVGEGGGSSVLHAAQGVLSQVGQRASLSDCRSRSLQRTESWNNREVAQSPVRRMGSPPSVLPSFLPLKAGRGKGSQLPSLTGEGAEVAGEESRPAGRSLAWH